MTQELGEIGASAESMSRALWAKIKNELRAELGEAVYGAWIKDLHLVERATRPSGSNVTSERTREGVDEPEDKTRLEAPTCLERDHIRIHYLHRIVARLSAHGVDGRMVEILVRPNLVRPNGAKPNDAAAHEVTFRHNAREAPHSAEAQNAAAQNAAAQNTAAQNTADGGDAVLARSASVLLHPHATREAKAPHADWSKNGVPSHPVAIASQHAPALQSAAAIDRFSGNGFASFIVSESNRVAFAQMKRLGENLPPTSQVIFLYAERGMGKTHLARAAIELLQASSDRRACYITAGEFREKFVAASMKNDFADFKRMMREVDVLVLDDLHTLMSSAGTQDEVFHTLRAVTARQGIVVLIANAAPASLAGLNTQLASDLEGALMLHIGAPDYAARRQIAETKAASLARHAPNFSLSPTLLDYVAERANSSCRAVNGAIISIFAKSLNGEQDVTRQLVDDVLRDQGVCEKRITIELVLRVTAEFYGVSRGDLEGPRRHKQIARIRQIAMFLCRELTNHGFPMIGTKFGKRHHSTVIYSCNEVESDRQQDPALVRELEQLRQMIRNRA